MRGPRKGLCKRWHRGRIEDNVHDCFYLFIVVAFIVFKFLNMFAQIVENALVVDVLINGSWFGTTGMFMTLVIFVFHDHFARNSFANHQKNIL